MNLTTGEQATGDGGTDQRPATADDVARDAVRPDPAASYESARAAPSADAEERSIVSAQLGRPARGNPAVVHRCRYGLPTVVRVDPRLDDGTPFPTTFWLTCPALRSQVGRLEADHAMAGLNERLREDESFASAHADAHRGYVEFRDSLGEPLPDAPGAGGTPTRVKCLHSHVAHHLATGDNVVGQWTLEHSTPLSCDGPCVPAASPSASSDPTPEMGRRA